MPYSLAEAAAATGMNKTSILRAIKSERFPVARTNMVSGWLNRPSCAGSMRRSSAAMRAPMQAALQKEKRHDTQRLRMWSYASVQQRPSAS